MIDASIVLPGYMSYVEWMHLHAFYMSLQIAVMITHYWLIAFYNNGFGADVEFRNGV